MRAYFNNNELKQRVIAGLKAHYDADEIAQGVYWNNGKGCAVGCVLHDLNHEGASNDHSRFELELGIPSVLACLIDCLFEKMSNKDAKEFPVEIMGAINVGSDLSLVWSKFVIWLLDEFLKDYEITEQSQFNAVIRLYKRTIKLERVTRKEWIGAARAARDAYASCGHLDDYAKKLERVTRKEWIGAARAARDAYANAVGCATYAAYVAIDAFFNNYDTSAFYDSVFHTASYAARAYLGVNPTITYENTYRKMSDKFIELVSECG